MKNVNKHFKFSEEEAMKLESITKIHGEIEKVHCEEYGISFKKFTQTDMLRKLINDEFKKLEKEGYC